MSFRHRPSITKGLQFAKGMAKGLLITTVRIVVIANMALLAAACERDEYHLLDNDRVIDINAGVAISNLPNMKDPDLNLVRYEEFLKYLSSSPRYMTVTQEEFDAAVSPDKVIVSLRHDVDRNLNGAMKIAYREHKYGIRSTFYMLHTADYYGSTSKRHFERNTIILDYLKKIQDTYGHEVSFHNDLVTLQVVYDIDPRAFLSGELSWLRSNGIRIAGSCTHGSPYCYVYKYLNTYFWETSPNYGRGFYNYEYIFMPQAIAASAQPQLQADNEVLIQVPQASESVNENLSFPHPVSEGIKIIKDRRENYGLEYDGDYLAADYNFSDVRIMPGGKRWHMGFEDFEKIPAGKKVIILIHPHFWD